MATLAEVRAKYPEYNDLSDLQLADGMYKKFYSDMPRAEFNRKIGLGLQGKVKPQTEAPQPSTNIIGPDGKQMFKSGGVENVSAGINEAIYDTVGGFADRAQNVINWGVAGVNALTGQKDLTTNMLRSDPILGSKWISDQFERIGVNDPDKVIASNLAERIARMGGQGVGYAVTPEGLLALLGKAGIVGEKALEFLKPLLGESKSVGGMAKNTVAGGTAGVGAQAAMEAAPDALDPLAATVGGLAGGFGGAAAMEAPAIVNAGARIAKDFVAPMTEGGRQMLVGRQLREGAADPQAAMASMTDAQPIIPGSQPTTFQQTGDMGLGAMERGAAAKDPAAFNTRRADQNTARMNAFEGVQATGAPEQVAQTVRARMAEIDQQTQAAVDAATQQARNAATSVGPGRAPEVAGDALRQTLETARAAAKTRERALWQAVDPDGTLALQAGNAKGQLARTLQEMPASAKRPEGEEAAIYGVLAQYGDVVPFSEMTALQSRLKTAMRTERLENGESAAYRRMTQLNSSLENDLEAAIVGRVQQQEQAVARGEMDAMDTIAAKLQLEARSFFDARQAATGEVGRVGSIGNAAGAPRPVSRPNGAEVSGGGRPGGASGNPRLSPDDLDPNFSGEALGRLRTARGATKARAETFDNSTLAPIRKRPGTTSPYDMPASAVPAKLFFSGPKSFDAIRTYRAAVGDEAALSALSDYAVDRLRRVAMRDDGTLDPAKLASWRRSHADALRAFPALDQQLANAGRVSEAMATAAAARRVAIDEAQQGAIAKLLRVEDPQDVTRVIGSLFGRADSVSQMMRLRSTIGDNAEALEGLRKAIADYMIDRFVSNTEAGTSGLGTLKADQLQTFIAQNKPALGVAGFRPDELNLFDNIAADLQQANRSIAAVKLPGGSNTTQDVLAAKANDSPSMTIAKAIAAASGTAGTAGFFAGGPIGAAAASIGGAIFAVLRQNGISKIDELLRDALLDPVLARSLMVKATPGNAKLVSITLRQRLARAAFASEAASAE